MITINKKFYDNVDKHYANQKKYITKFVDLNEQYVYQLSKDPTGSHIITLIDEDTGKSVLRAKYHIVGMYNVYNFIWYWGWNIDHADKQLTQKSKQVYDFSNQIKKNISKNDPHMLEEIYFRTHNGNYYTSFGNVPPILKLALYLLKDIWYLAICHDTDKVHIAQKCVLNNKYNEELHLKKVEYIMLEEIIQF